MQPVFATASASKPASAGVILFMFDWFGLPSGLRRDVSQPNSMGGAFQEAHHAIAVLHGFLLNPAFGDCQRISPRVAQHKTSARREQLGQVRVIEELLRE